MSRKNPEGHKDLLKRAFQREDAGGVARYVYYHDDRYYFVLAACTRLDLDFEAKSDRLIVPADSFESSVLDGASLVRQPEQAAAPFPPASENAFEEDVDAVAPPPVAASAFSDDDTYEEEEFVFTHASPDDADSDAEEDIAPFVMPAAADPSYLINEDDGSEEDMIAAAAPESTAPVFMTHQFIEKTSAPEEITTPSDPDAAEEEFVFMLPEDEDAPEALRWDDMPDAAGIAPEDHDPAAPEALDLPEPFTVPAVTPEVKADAEDGPAALASGEPESTAEELLQGAPEREPEAIPVAAPVMPQISIVQVQETAISKRTEGVHAREQALSDREGAASDREKSVILREDSVEERRKDMARRERRIERRRKELEALQRKLKARQEYLGHQREMLGTLRSAAQEIMEG